MMTYLPTCENDQFATSVSSLNMNKTFDPSVSVPFKQVPEPSYFKPTDEEFYAQDPVTGEQKPNGTFLKAHFFQEGRLTEDQAMFILDKVTELLSREPNMVEVKSPVTSQ
jgi:hypothetical protein